MPSGVVPLTFCGVDRLIAQLAPDPAIFNRHLALVQAYVQSRPGSHTALMDAANADPEGMTTSIVALGAVLLDVAAGAFRMTPDEMLAKIATGVASFNEGDPAL